MDKKEKKKLSESDICDLFISPAIRDAGWDPLAAMDGGVIAFGFSGVVRRY